MALQFNISLTKDKRHYGVYVRSASALALYLLAPKLPELKPEQIPVYNDSDETLTLTGAIPLFSDRLARFKTEKKAISFLKKLKKLPEQEQVAKIWHLYIRPVEKDLAIIKPQYHQVHRVINGKMVKQFTTNNTKHANDTALTYTDMGITNKLVKTVTRNTVVTKASLEEQFINGKIVTPYSNGMDLKPEVTKGARKGEHTFNKRAIYTKRKS